MTRRPAWAPKAAEVQARLQAVRAAEAERREVVVTDRAEGWGIMLALFDRAKAGAQNRGRSQSERVADWLAALDIHETMRGIGV